MKESKDLETMGGESAWDDVLKFLAREEWTGLGAIIGGMSLGFTIYEHVTQQDKKNALMIIKEIVKAIEALKEELLEDMQEIINELEFNTIKGKYTSLLELLRLYDRCPEEGKRIENMINYAVDVWGPLQNKVDDNRLEIAIRAWPVYISVIALRNFAMAEYSLYYGGHDLHDIPPMFDRALISTQRIIHMIHRASDDRFSRVMRRADAEGFPEWVYIFEGETACRDINENHCSVSRTIHMAREFNYTMHKTEARKMLEFLALILIRRAYCRILERPVDQSGLETYTKKIVEDGWTVKNLIEVLVKSPEHKQKFIDPNSPEKACNILVDHLLAENDGSSWVEHFKSNGISSTIDAIMTSDKYKNNFGDDEIPGSGRSGCWSKLEEYTPNDIDILVPCEPR